MAVNESWTDGSTGEKKTKTTWINVTVWGKQAETAEKWLKKGQAVFIEGKLEIQEVVGEGGEKKSYTQVRCSNFIMLGRKDEEDSPKSGGSAKPAADQGAQTKMNFDEDDIPY